MVIEQTPVHAAFIWCDAKNEGRFDGTQKAVGALPIIDVSTFVEDRASDQTPSDAS